MTPLYLDAGIAYILALDLRRKQLFYRHLGIGDDRTLMYKQVGSDTGAGAILGGFRGKGAGIGPAIYFIRKIRGKDVYFITKWLRDYHAENRIRGDYAYTASILEYQLKALESTTAALIASR